MACSMGRFRNAILRLTGLPHGKMMAGMHSAVQSGVEYMLQACNRATMHAYML